MNVFHELWVIHVPGQVENPLVTFTSHRFNFKLVHWVLLRKFNCEWKSSWLLSMRLSFLHQEIIVAGWDCSEAHFVTSLDSSGCKDLETVLFCVELGIGACVVVIGEVVQEWHQSVSCIIFLHDTLEMLISDDPCFFVFLKREFSSRFSWHFLLDKVVIAFNCFLQGLNMWI